MNRIVAIPLPLPHVRSVNAWLLRGDPVTLIDTGPRADGALAALEEGLRREGLRVEDIELLLATHHHLDHVGLAATIQRRSGAAVAVLDRTADYAARYAAEVDEDRRFARSLMAHHGVPEQLVAETESFWQYIRDTTEDFRADVRLADGDRRAGRRAPPAGGGAPRSQHHRHAVRRRTRCRRVRRRPPAGDDLVQHGDLPARACARRPRPLAPALPGGPRAHAIDAARPAS